MAKRGRVGMMEVPQLTIGGDMGKGDRVCFDPNHRRSGEAMGRLGAMQSSVLIIDEMSENGTAEVRNPQNGRAIEVPVICLVRF
ncbi:MAG: hypothetical protein AAB453_00760 [Patescibacteria group bacterium]